MLSQGTSCKSRDRAGAGTSTTPTLSLVLPVPPVSAAEVDVTWTAPVTSGAGGPTPGALVTWTKSGELIVDEPCGCYFRNGANLRRCAPHAAYLRRFSITATVAVAA